MIPIMTENGYKHFNKCKMLYKYVDNEATTALKNNNDLCSIISL